MFKAQANHKKYDVLYITENTSVNTLANFIHSRSAIKIKMHGIGFNAEHSLSINFANGKSIDLEPNTVLIRSKENNFGLMDYSTYQLVFDEIEEEQK